MATACRSSIGLFVPQQIGFRATTRRRAKGKCECCGKRISKRINSASQGTIHHRYPRRFGLDNSPENLMHLRLECHRRIHQDENLAAMRGFIVHSEPGDTPVLLHRHRWVLLGPGGGYRDLPEAEALALIGHVETLRMNPHVAYA